MSTSGPAADRVRGTLTVPEPAGGWVHPWPVVAEVAQTIDPRQWTLVGGLMVQAHAIGAGLAAHRPTNDVDVVLHVETGETTPARVVGQLRSLGFDLVPPSVRTDPTHRMTRPRVPAQDGAAGLDSIDVMVADHARPEDAHRFGGQKVFRIPGGTQALRRTLWLQTTVEGEPLRVSLPSAFAALVLKGAAYRLDSRAAGRHLEDAAVLSACISDALACREQMRGSDRKRVRDLYRELGDARHTAWRALPSEQVAEAHATLGILAADPPPSLHSARDAVSADGLPRLSRPPRS